MLLLCLGGCTDQRAAVDELIGHTEAMVAILEAHSGAPEAALDALEAYESDNRQALDDLASKSRRIRADLGQRSKRGLRAYWLERSKELRMRLQALTEGAATAESGGQSR